MSQQREPPRVTFRVRYGRQVFDCTGHLVWEGGIVFAIPDAIEADIFLPEKVRLEESDLESRHDPAEGRDSYVYHGFVVVPF